MTLLRGFYTADASVLFELEHLLTRLETERFAVSGKPLPPKLAQVRREMRTLIATSATHESPLIPPSAVCSTTESVTIGTMQASKILGISQEMTRRRCDDGSLPAVQTAPNGSWRILRASVLEEMRSK